MIDNIKDKMQVFENVLNVCGPNVEHYHHSLREHLDTVDSLATLVGATDWCLTKARGLPAIKLVIEDVPHHFIWKTTSGRVEDRRWYYEE